ncbi:MAG: hypothetical protein ACLFRV_01700, partial [Acidimicrobiales bacterium]
MRARYDAEIFLSRNISRVPRIDRDLPFSIQVADQCLSVNGDLTPARWPMSVMLLGGTAELGVIDPVAVFRPAISP